MDIQMQIFDRWFEDGFIDVDRDVGNSLRKVLFFILFENIDEELGLDIFMEGKRMNKCMKS